MKNTTHQNLNNYYFTFGSDIEYPYQDTYLIIKSDNYYNARGIFPKIYPSRDVSGALNFAFQYSEDEWLNVSRYYEGQKPAAVITDLGDGNFEIEYDSRNN